MNKYALNAIITFLLISTSVDAQSLWTDSEEGFAARFPTNPDKVEAAGRAGSGYAYQSIKQFDKGGVLFAITVFEPISRNLQTDKLKDFMDRSNDEFTKSMGKNPEYAKINWTEFGDGRPQLNYGFSFQYQGAKFKARGYWIIDRERILRVSVTYAEKISREEAKEVVGFLDTFVILKN